MKRIAILVLAGLLSIAGASMVIGDGAHSSGTGHGQGAAAAAKSMVHTGTLKTLRGELVDTGCYLGHEARGEKHIGCATKCIAGGMPMGLLTADGTLYLVTMNHDNADPYNALKEMAGKTLDVTGTVMARGGMKGIDVTAFKAVATAAR